MKPLSHFVHQAWRVARALPAPLRELPERPRAAAIAFEVWGEAVVAAKPVLLNIAALADAARSRLVVHQLKPQTVELIDATDLRSTPTEPPALMREPWIVEAADIDHPLAGGVIGCGAYELDGRTFVVALTSNGGAQSGEVTLHWDTDLGPTFDDHGAGEAGLLGVTLEQWAEPLCQAIRSALMLGILVDAERTPLGHFDAHPKPRKGATRDERRDAEAWTVRTCAVRATALRSAPVAAGQPVDGAYRLAVETPVRGHLKRQPHGPKGSERKYVWIESYEARRWVAPATKVRM